MSFWEGWIRDYSIINLKSFISRGVRRKRQFEMHVDSPLSEINYPMQGSTGLTQEIDTMDIGSSTPKKRRAKSPLKGVLKVK